LKFESDFNWISFPLEIIDISSKNNHVTTIRVEDDSPIVPKCIIVDEEIFELAIELGNEYGVISASKLQRVFRIGYNRASRIMDRLEDEGYLGGLAKNLSREFIQQE